MGVVFVVAVVGVALADGVVVGGDDDQAPPRVTAASKTQHRNPLAKRWRAVTKPADPAPTTATSIMVYSL
jgi:hypothetical protein